MMRSRAYYAADLNHLPDGSIRRGPQGAKTGLSLEHRAILDGMRDELIALMDGDGVSRAWVSERTGIPLNHVSIWLREHGAKSHANSLWRRPSLARRMRAGAQ